MIDSTLMKGTHPHPPIDHYRTPESSQHGDTGKSQPASRPPTLDAVLEVTVTTPANARNKETFSGLVDLKTPGRERKRESFGVLMDMETPDKAEAASSDGGYL